MDAIESLPELPLTPADAAAAAPLSIEAGWNQTLADWDFMLTYGRGLGVRDGSGRLIGSALTLPLGERLRWISMVLVAGARRRNGIGTKLLRRCIAAVRGEGAVAGLDATELGRPVYLPLGFRDLYAISRWRLDQPVALRHRSAEFLVRAAVAADLPAVLAFDAARSGMRRTAVLRYLLAAAPQRAFVVERQGRLSGYSLGRAGHLAVQVGPVVADNAEAALALLRTVVERPVVLDVPDAHTAVGDWLRSCGAVRQRGFVRMVLGEPPRGLGDPDAVFALAGPELG